MRDGIKAKAAVHIALSQLSPKDQAAVHQLMMQSSTGLMTKVDLTFRNVIVQDSHMCIHSDEPAHVHLEFIALGDVELTTPQETERQAASP